MSISQRRAASIRQYKGTRMRARRASCQGSSDHPHDLDHIGDAEALDPMSGARDHDGMSHGWGGLLSGVRTAPEIRSPPGRFGTLACSTTSQTPEALPLETNLGRALSSK
jgi:hypothetical protein